MSNSTQMPVDIDKSDGRPPLLVREDGMVDRVIENLQTYPTMDMIAAASGISRRTLFNWLKRGRKVRALREEDPDAQISRWDDAYLEFLEEFEEKELEIKKKHYDRIDDAGADNWTASAWILERLWPGEFSLKQVVRHEGEVKEDIQVSLNIEKPDHGGREIEEADFKVIEEVRNLGKEVSDDEGIEE